MQHNLTRGTLSPRRKCKNINLVSATFPFPSPVLYSRSKAAGSRRCALLSFWPSPAPRERWPCPPLHPGSVHSSLQAGLSHPLHAHLGTWLVCGDRWGLEILMHLRYIISLYASFGLNLSEDEYTQFSRNTRCYSFSIYLSFFSSVSTVAGHQWDRGGDVLLCYQHPKRSKGNWSFRVKGSWAAAPAPWDHKTELRCNAHLQGCSSTPARG